MGKAGRIAWVDYSRLQDAGLKLAEDRGYPDGPESAIWALTEEAAETFKASAMPGPAAYPKKWSMGDPLRDYWEQFSTEVERKKDRLEIDPPKIRIVPTSAAITRADIMHEIWRDVALSRYGSRVEIIKALWMWAGGVRPTRINALTGISRQRLYRAREKALEELTDHIFPVGQHGHDKLCFQI